MHPSFEHRQFPADDVKALVRQWVIERSAVECWKKCADDSFVVVAVERACFASVSEVQRSMIASDEQLSGLVVDELSSEFVRANREQRALTCRSLS